MPVVGERKSAQRGYNYARRPEAGYAKKFAEAVSDIRDNAGVDIFSEVARAYSLDEVNDSMKNFFMEDAIQEGDVSQYTTPEDIEDANEMLSEQYTNDVEAIREYANIGGMNPVIGMTPFIHKSLLMNTVFDNGVIPRFVARAPKFTLSLETRIMRNAAGDEIDMWLEQNKIFDMMESTAPMLDTFMKLPENQTTDVLATFGANALDDNLSIESNISAVLLQSWIAKGEKTVDPDTGKESAQTADGLGYQWFLIPPKYFRPAYGEHDRQMMDSFAVTVKVDGGNSSTNTPPTTKLVSGSLMGYVKKNRFVLNCTEAAVKAVRLTSRIDTSTAMIRTCTVDWKVRTDIVEIPNAIPINTAISPEEVKDLATLYQVNQLTKIMSMFKLVLSNYKDEKIHRFLDKSFINMPNTNKFAGTFNFEPKTGYFSDPIDWREKMFIDQLETFVTPMIQVLNDPNMTITVVGRSDLIRKVTPNDNISYSSPGEVASIQMDWKKTVVTADRRTYQFISTDKMRDNNNLIVILTPRNSERIIYRLYDYQMYVSNEIRNAANWALPAIHAFERFKAVEYQPVQGRLRILNPTGMSEYKENEDPIGVNRANDYTANIPDAVRKQYENAKLPAAGERVAIVDPNAFIY